MPSSPWSTCGWAGVAKALTALPALLLMAVAAAAQPATRLPPDVARALQRAGLPADALAAVVHDATTGQRVLEWQPARPLNPASLVKLLTTSAALERLGPAWSWTTPVWLAGPLRDGVLDGQVHLQGSGDPAFSAERVAGLLRRLQQLGVREIRGDIVLDQSAFALPPMAAGDFDGEPLRPHNVQPAALLFAQRALRYTFTPDSAAGLARVSVEPGLATPVAERTVPLAPGACNDWRVALKPQFEAASTRFGGAFAGACGELSWLVADAEPASFEARLLQGLWREMGGRLRGRVRVGPAPTDLAPAFELRSPPLAEVVREINKSSNNLMAQQLFLTLALQARPGEPATLDSARETLLRWLAERTGALGDEVIIDNGSGLSRLSRISAQRLAQVLLLAWDGPLMSELMSSLPISGVDGTLRRARTSTGRAHLKTGSLRDVAALGGYVLSNSGRRYVFVALVNHEQAREGRPALDALLQWTMRDAPAF
jgi:serine-type D-Ala-D-Ala carboxypeptidase/endopeptidase (penicillin-binding protein 4)